MKSLPNILTLSRMVLVPLIVILFYLGDSRFIHILLTAIFGYACLTDFLDGYIARTYEYQSKFGRLFDPIADKVLVGSVILMLVHFDKIDIFPALAIICREIMVSGLREYLSEINVSVPVTNLSKIKTAVQMGAIMIILLGSKGLGIEEIYGIDVMYWLGRVAIWLAAILTLVTGYAYFKASLKHI